MAFFKPGKIFELQKWTEDESLNGKILGIIDKKNGKGSYPCYIFETQKVISATAAQLTYPDLDANNKKKLIELLEQVIEQKKNYQLNLAEKAQAEERRKLLEKKEREQQAKIQAAIPSVVFDVNNTNDITPTPTEGGHNSTQTRIVIQQPPNNLYNTDQSNDNLLIEKRDSAVPKGYALVPVETLNEVVAIKNQEEKLQQKELLLVAKQNELSLAEKEVAMESKKREMELEAKQKEIEMQRKGLGDMEKTVQKREDYNRKYEEEIMRKQKGDNRKKRNKKDRDEYDDDKDRKRSKKKKKKRKKNDGCTTGKCCKCLLKMSSICLIIAFVAGIAGCYFYFIGNDDENVYAFIAWAGAIVALVFGVCFYCKG